MKKNLILLLFCSPVIYFTSSCDNAAQVAATTKASTSTGATTQKSSKAGLNSLVTKVRSVEVSPLSLEMPLSEQTTVTAKVHLNDGSEETTVVWQSEDPNVATIDSTGHIKSLKEGKTKITALSKDEPDKSASLMLVVSRTASIPGQELSLALPNPSGIGNSAAVINLAPKPGKSNNNGVLLGVPTHNTFIEPSPTPTPIPKK